MQFGRKTEYMTHRKPKPASPKNEHQMMAESPSLFSQTMRIQENAQRYHQETDHYLKNFKRETLLQILLKIKENPPPYIADDPSGARAVELDTVFNELKQIVENQNNPKTTS